MMSLHFTHVVGNDLKGLWQDLEFDVVHSPEVLAFGNGTVFSCHEQLGQLVLLQADEAVVLREAVVRAAAVLILVFFVEAVAFGMIKVEQVGLGFGINGCCCEQRTSLCLMILETEGQSQLFLPFEEDGERPESSETLTGFVCCIKLSMS